MTQIEHWRDFFVAEAGAAAALAGLLFVAVSINLPRILEFKHLPTRALEALAALISVLVIATFALIPDQSLATLGYEIAGAGLTITVVQIFALVLSHQGVAKYVSWTQHALMNLTPPLPFLVAGVLMILGDANGLYWLVPGVLLSFLAGVLGAWVLLVEIHR
ncbi:MAG: hypothetical protein ABUS48_00560 [Pseudomonadota bacterium]